MKPERQPHQARNLQELRPPFGPAALAHHAVLLDRAAMRREQQHHGVVRDLLDEGVRAVGDRNALLGRGRHVDIVDADAAERDDAALVERLDHRPVELHALGIDRIDALGRRDEVRLGGRALEDLGVQSFERLHFEIVVAAAVAERKRRRA